MTPKRWTPGDPISAARLNEQIAEALRPRRSAVVGPGQSTVNDLFGNQASHPSRHGAMFCVATEDFTTSNTDLYAATDQAPSGKCLLMRLNTNSGDYEQEVNRTPFRVWDPIAGYTGTASKTEGDVFYAVWNADSQRLEVLGATETPIRTALICRCLGEGWYVAELSSGIDQPPEYYPSCVEPIDSDSASASASASDSSSASEADPCDLCGLLNDEDCGEVLPLDVGRIPGSAGIGVYVFVKSLRHIPLKINGEVLITWLGDMLQTSDSASQSDSASESVDEDDDSRKLWYVLNGEYELTTIPHEDWECCTDEFGNQSVQRISCTTFIVEGVACETAPTPCPDVSGSTSESV